MSSVLSAISVSKMRIVGSILITILLSQTDCYGSGSKLSDIHRIIGGWEADITEYPYQVSLENRREHFCGGSIISKEFILTAAHCVYDFRNFEVKIRAGTSYQEHDGQLIDVLIIYRHPLFTKDNPRYDIAILKLVENIKFSEYALPIGLATEFDRPPQPGDIAVVTGWGRLQEDFPNVKPIYLRTVNLPIISLATCRSYYPFHSITEDMICAGYSTGGRGSCYGDSGGPLVLNGVQIGVVSWGIRCAAPNRPAVFTSVAKLRHFIDSIIQYDIQTNTYPMYL